MPTTIEIPTQSAADVCGMFVIDAGGKIVAANVSAREFWENIGRPFVGAFLPSLIAISTVDSDWKDAEVHWQAFKATTLDRWTSCLARQADGSSRGVRLRVERVVGGGGSFMATIRPGAAEK